MGNNHSISFGNKIEQKTRFVGGTPLQCAVGTLHNNVSFVQPCCNCVARRSAAKRVRSVRSNGSRASHALRSNCWRAGDPNIIICIIKLPCILKLKHLKIIIPERLFILSGIYNYNAFHIVKGEYFFL